LVLLFSGFRLASDSWDAVYRGSSSTTENEMARALVRRVVTQLQPVRWKRALNQAMAFTGEPNRLLALAPVSSQAGLGGLRVIEFAAERLTLGGRASFVLILRQAPIRYETENFSDSLAESEPVRILEDLTNVQFSYFGSPKRGEPAQWFDSWPNPEELPQLVRIRLESQGAGWPDLLVAPMIGGTGCRWNAFYKKCMTSAG
jgi:hypothetical protein